MKEFLPYDSVRIDALKLAHKIYQQDKFVPDVIYTSLRGGAYMANVISEYYKVALKNHKPVLYAAVVARSYTDVSQHSAVRIDGWTYSPDYLRAGDKIMLVDDIFDSGRTLNLSISTRPLAKVSILIAEGKRSRREISCAAASSGLMIMVTPRRFLIKLISLA